MLDSSSLKCGLEKSFDILPSDLFSLSLSLHKRYITTKFWSSFTVSHEALVVVVYMQRETIYRVWHTYVDCCHADRQRERDRREEKRAGWDGKAARQGILPIRSWLFHTTCFYYDTRPLFVIVEAKEDTLVGIYFKLLLNRCISYRHTHTHTLPHNQYALPSSLQVSSS